MTRSKIFLGITTATLAIAGVAAAKRTGTNFTRFYVTFNGEACCPLRSTCVLGGTMTCLGTYTDGLGNVKAGALFTQGGSSTTWVPASKCKNKALWDGIH